MVHGEGLVYSELKFWSGPLNHTYSNAQYICIHTQLMQCICKINVSYFSLYSLQSFKCFMQKVFECTLGKEQISFSNFSCMFLNPNNYNCSNLLDMRNLQEQVKKAFFYQKLFWPFTVWMNCSSDLKNFANSRPSASNFKSFSRSLEQFFLTVG